MIDGDGSAAPTRRLTKGERRRLAFERKGRKHGATADATAPAAAVDAKKAQKSEACAVAGVDELNEMDDWGSAWQEVKDKGERWGGRGRGGRGIQRNTFQPRDVYVEGVTLAYQGTELLDRTTLRLGAGRRYGLVGANGVGKSTLLHRIAAGAVPGWPLHLRTSLVQQDAADDAGEACVLDTVLAADTRRAALLEEVHRLEGGEEGPAAAAAAAGEGEGEGEGAVAVGSGVSSQGGADGGDAPVADGPSVEEQAARINEIYEELAQESAEEAKARATAVLVGLRFTSRQLARPASELSGGWRMRLKLACALHCRPDILLLDEPTNHLDLEGQIWLRLHLQRAEGTTVVVVSHDPAFLDAVCTDVLRFHDRRLSHHPGDYSAFLKARHDRVARMGRAEEALQRQRKHMEESVRSMEKAARGKGGDQKKSAQVASRRKKLERHGLEKNEQGHRRDSDTLHPYGCPRKVILLSLLRALPLGIVGTSEVEGDTSDASMCPSPRDVLWQEVPSETSPPGLAQWGLGRFSWGTCAY